jgi:hypothetical protein
MTRLKTRLTAAALATGGALLLLPTAGQAAQTFGSRLNHDPANSGECVSLLTPCTIASYIVPTDPNGDPSSAGAPADGVITTFRIRAFGDGNAPAQVTFRLADVTLPNPMDQTAALATAAGTGPTVTIPVPPGPDTPILSFPGHLTVKKGQHLAIDGTNVQATVNDSGSKFSYVFAPPLVDGQGARGSSSVTGELLVQATIEPDADGDGFGDETQDQCPSQAVTQGACVPPPSLPRDTTPPTVSKLGVGGGTIAYTLSEAATVTLQLSKGSTGRKVSGTCVRRTRRNRRKPHCTRFGMLGKSFSGPGSSGANQLALPKPGGRKLGPGLYRLTMTARDAAGNERTTTKQFQIVKPKPKHKR